MTFIYLFIKYHEYQNLLSLLRRRVRPTSFEQMHAFTYI